MAWPSIQNPSLTTQTKVKDNSLRSEFVNGQSVSRARYTRQLREWRLKWNAMPDTDLATLLTWFDTCAGGSASFSWSDEFGNSYTVRFAGDIQHYSVTGEHSAVDLTLEEV